MNQTSINPKSDTEAPSKKLWKQKHLQPLWQQMIFSFNQATIDHLNIFQLPT